VEEAKTPEENANPPPINLVMASNKYTTAEVESQKLCCRMQERQKSAQHATEGTSNRKKIQGIVANAASSRARQRMQKGIRGREGEHGSVVTQQSEER